MSNEEVCPRCKGQGKYLAPDAHHGHSILITCSKCRGTGIMKNRLPYEPIEFDRPGYMKSGEGQFIGHQFYEKKTVFETKTEDEELQKEKVLEELTERLNKEIDKVEEKQLKKASPLDIQFGGNHYKTKAIQPIEFIMANNMSYPEGCVVKYITRYKEKNGKEDLLKARHYIDFLLENYDA